MYGLTLPYFSTSPKTDRQVFFARNEEFRRFFEDMTGTIESGRTPRYVVFGLYGIGKTHFLYHLQYEISRTKVADAVYVETPSCHKRTSFVDFYRAIVTTLGKDLVIQNLADGLANRKKIDLGLSEDLAVIVENALKKKQGFLLRKWLNGEKLKASEAELLEAVYTQLTDQDAVTILNALAIIHEHANGRPLIILVDEFENTLHIAGDARVSFTEAMRSLVDDTSRMGVVFALTSRGLAEMPDSLYRDTVRRRIGLTNFIAFKPYDENELERFIHEAIGYRRDPKFNMRNALATLESGETSSPETYPFTIEAVKEIVASVILFAEQDKIETIRPKEALEIMDKALRVTSSEKSTLIGKDIILQVRNEVVEALRL
jgi:Cdc6-like AAA superfamily ATPase